MIEVPVYEQQPCGENEGDVKSAARVLDVLDLLASKGCLSLAEITRALKMPKSSASGLLKTALSRGYVSLDPESRGFRLGIKLLRIASSFSYQPDLIAAFQKVTPWIQEQCNETVQLGILEVVDVV